MTKEQRALVRRLTKGNIRIQDALDESGFSAEDVAEAVRLPLDELKERAAAGEKVKDLPFAWRVKLQTAAMRLGLR